MENTAAVAKKISDVNWKEIGITAGIVLVTSFAACLGALFVHEAIKSSAAKKAAKKEETKK